MDSGKALIGGLFPYFFVGTFIEATKYRAGNCGMRHFPTFS